MKILQSCKGNARGKSLRGALHDEHLTPGVAAELRAAALMGKDRLGRELQYTRDPFHRAGHQRLAHLAQFFSNKYKVVLQLCMQYR